MHRADGDRRLCERERNLRLRRAPQCHDGPMKALSWLNLLFEMRAYAVRIYREGRFSAARCPAFEVLPARLVSCAGSVSPPW